jgi:leukotriene-A4 hydrolase
LADQYITLAGKSSPALFKDYLDQYYSALRVIFLQQLNTRFADVDLEIMAKVDADYNVTGTEDPECKEAWLPLGIRKNYTPAYEVAHEFISTQGRMKYLQPVYQALLDSNQRDLAVKWFEENILFYHPYSVAKLKKMLGLTDADIENLTVQKKMKAKFNFIQ